MPEFVRVRVKETGALIWVGDHEVNDSFEVLDHQPAQPVGGYSPTPKKNVPSAAPRFERVVATDPKGSGDAKEPSGKGGAGPNDAKNGARQA